MAGLSVFCLRVQAHPGLPAVRIAIDATACQTAHRYRGIGVYTRNLILSLARLDTLNQYYLLHFEGMELDLPITQPNFKFHALAGSGAPRAIALPPRSGKWNAVRKLSAQLWLYQLALPYALSQLKPDLFHAPALTVEPTLPLLSLCKTVVTIHDIVPLLFPDRYLADWRSRTTYRLSLRAARRAARVITDSSSARQDLVRAAHFQPDDVTVVPLAVDPFFCPLDREVARSAVRERFGLVHDFVLYVGAADFAKNLERLVTAYLAVAAKVDCPPLVIVGKISSELAELEARLNPPGRDSPIILLGYVSQPDLLTLYNAARLFVMPVLDQGFGLPVLEAMTCGTPVVTSDLGSVREVAGDAALLVNPYRVEDIEHGIRQVLSDESLQKELRERGLRRAAEFSEDAMARAMLAAYTEVATYAAVRPAFA